PGYPRQGGTIGFVGRFTEPRKGMIVLLRAFARLVDELPDLQLLVVGRGDPDELTRMPGVDGRLELLNNADDVSKARAMRSMDVYCAPNTGGESFGMILTEAMAAGTAVVASDIDAFRRVLDDGKAGTLVPVHDDVALAAALRDVLHDPGRRADLTE